MHGKTVWIVDATDPLGKALARTLNTQGNFVIASGRDPEALAQLSRDSAGAIAELALDLDDAASIDAAREQLRTLSDRLDVVVANHAWQQPLARASFDAEACGHHINSNYMAMVKTLAMAMPLLRRSRAPYIVCAGSAVTRLPLAGVEAYGAAAAAAEYFARALALEVKAQNIDLSIVRAGLLAGSLTDSRQADRPLTASAEWSARFAMPAEDAVQRLLSGMERRQRIIHLPRTLGWLVALAGVLPGAWVRGMLAYVNRQSGVVG